ncbi:hypothetical protein [Deinococcus apachensis]|uniref:hypothetical protein n=1 Tax=Deinococcus apachensis TaxID=309886 RepID=UPI000364D3B9|nr:hypothetical protein [Deinococcus apachensis]
MRRLKPLQVVGILYAVALVVSFLLFRGDPSEARTLWAGAVLIGLVGLLVSFLLFYQARQTWRANRKGWAFPLVLLRLYWLFRTVGVTADAVSTVLSR